VLGWRPFAFVSLSPVESFSSVTNILVGQFRFDHVDFGCSLILECHCQECSVELELHVPQWVAEVFGLDTVTTSLEERLEHVEGNAVVILTSCLEDFGVLPVVGAKLLEVLTWVLIWAASLDAVLDVIILVDRG
jgi:hypothetical protein